MWVWRGFQGQRSNFDVTARPNAFFRQRDSHPLTAFRPLCDGVAGRLTCFVLRPLDGIFLFLNFFFVFFSFYQSTVLSIRAEDGYQMYFGGSVVGEASTIVIGITLTPPLIFIGDKKCEIWRRLKQHLNLSRPHWKCSKKSEFWSKRAMQWWMLYVLSSLVKLSPRTGQLCHFLPSSENSKRA